MTVLEVIAPLIQDGIARGGVIFTHPDTLGEQQAKIMTLLKTAGHAAAHPIGNDCCRFTFLGASWRMQPDPAIPRGRIRIEVTL